jgi:thioredoxin reductase (NADPH)
MVRPVVLAVDDEPAVRSSIEGELRKRYGADYEVRCEGSGTAGLAALEQVKAQGGEVALVVADLWMPDMTGVEFLARVRGLHPNAKRAVLAAWGDRRVGDTTMRATALGQIDDWGLKPWRAGDEQFHQLIARLLYEWARPGWLRPSMAPRRASAPACWSRRRSVGRPAPAP